MNLMKKEKAKLAQGVCPFCGCGAWREGPHGGACVNLECAKCEARFNVGPGGFQELIRLPPQEKWRPTKPNWFVRKFRRWILRRCPYCSVKLERGLVGLFLNGFYGCPRGHYAEEMVIAAGGATIIYDNGGALVFQPPLPDPDVEGRNYRDPLRSGRVIQLAERRRS